MFRSSSDESLDIPFQTDVDIEQYRNDADFLAQQKAIYEQLTGRREVNPPTPVSNSEEMLERQKETLRKLREQVQAMTLKKQEALAPTPKEPLRGILKTPAQAAATPAKRDNAPETLEERVERLRKKLFDAKIIQQRRGRPHNNQNHAPLTAENLKQMQGDVPQASGDARSVNSDASRGYRGGRGGRGRGGRGRNPDGEDRRRGRSRQRYAEGETSGDNRGNYRGRGGRGRGGHSYQRGQSEDGSETGGQPKYYNDECPVCTEDFTLENGRYMVLDCRHRFHNACVLQWAQKQSNLACAICNQGIPKVV